MVKKWIRKTIAMDYDTYRVLNSLKNKKKKSYNSLLKELAVKEMAKKKRKSDIQKGLIDLLFE